MKAKVKAGLYMALYLVFSPLAIGASAARQSVSFMSVINLTMVKRGSLGSYRVWHILTGMSTN